MFNTRRLKLPPTCCLKNTVNKYSNEQIDVCRGVLHECTSILSNHLPWSTEHFVLSRLIYKMNCQFRINKSLQLLKRVQVCVSRYCEMEILLHVKQLKEMFNSDVVSSMEVFLPSRQMLESLLVQMMGAVALLTQTAKYCLHTYEYLKMILEIGHFIPQNLLFISVICRIWALSRSTSLHFISWYNQLYDTLDHLEATKVPWLTDGYVLPSDLSKFLQQEHGDFEKLNMDSSVPDIEEIQSRYTSTSGVSRNVFDEIDDTEDIQNATEMEDLEDIGCSVLRREDDVSMENSESNLTSDKNVELSISKRDKTCHTSFVHCYTDKVSACSSLQQLKKLAKSLSKQNLNDAQKLKVQRCHVKLKKFKIKETELIKNGKNTRKFIDKGRNCIHLLLHSLDNKKIKVPQKDTLMETQETTNINVVEENETSFLDFLRTASKADIRRMTKELKENNFLTHDSKLYRPSENSVTRKLCIKLKKVSKLNEGGKKEIVLRKIDTLLKMCKQSELVSKKVLNKKKMKKNQT